MTAFDLKSATVEQLQARMGELQGKMISLDTPADQVAAIQTEMMSLIAEIRTKKESHGKELAEVVSKVKGFKFTIKEIFGENAIELFSDLEITQAYKDRGLNSTAVAETKERKERKAAIPKVFASDSNPVLLHIPLQADDHQRVADVVLNQGRANEFYVGKAMFAPGNLPKPLFRCKGKDVKETKKNLEKFVVAESKAYEHKDAELTKIAEVVFAFVPKEKAADTEPHNEVQAEMAKA